MCTYLCQVYYYVTMLCCAHATIHHAPQYQMVFMMIETWFNSCSTHHYCTHHCYAHKYFTQPFVFLSSLPLTDGDPIIQRLCILEASLIGHTQKHTHRHAQTLNRCAPSVFGQRMSSMKSSHEWQEMSRAKVILEGESETVTDKTELTSLFLQTLFPPACHFYALIFKSAYTTHAKTCECMKIHAHTHTSKCTYEHILKMKREGEKRSHDVPPFRGKKP